MLLEGINCFLYFGSTADVSLWNNSRRKSLNSWFLAIVVLQRLCSISSAPRRWSSLAHGSCADIIVSTLGAHVRRSIFSRTVPYIWKSAQWPQNRRMLPKNAWSVMIPWFLPTSDVRNVFYAKNTPRIIYFQRKRARFHGQPASQNIIIDLQIPSWWRRLHAPLSFDRLDCSPGPCITFGSTQVDAVSKNDKVGSYK